jgi:outer membrane receptor protein involved in Fe transport
VLRAASAEYSTQSIAGTINIVLRRAISTRQRELKAGYAGGQGLRNPNLNLQLSDKMGRMSYSVSAGWNNNRFDRENPSLEEYSTPSGILLARESFAQRQVGDFNAFNVAPRVNWNLENGDTLTSQSFINYFRGHITTQQDLAELTGTLRGFPHIWTATNNDGTFLRSDLNWVHKLGNSAKIDMKIGANYGEFNSGDRRLGEAANGQALQDVASKLESSNKGVSTTGKYTQPLMESHSLGMGWDGGVTRLHAANLETGFGTPADDSYDGHIDRLALYAQDEWNYTKQLSLYLGVRWEGINTTTSGTTFAESTSRLSVWSPLMQVLYKLPNSKADQLRFALTRTFKAPQPIQLLPRRTRSLNNTPVSPDTQGNLHLEPELATGIDASYEHYWAQGGVFSVASSARKITGYTVQGLFQDTDGRWVSMPVNGGSARTESLEVEGKFPLKVFMQDAPPLDVRASVSRNWSRVESVPGPNNRLDQQTPLSATLGLDYKIGSLTTGGSYTFRNGGLVRISDRQVAYQTVRRDVEVYGLWKFTPKQQFRFSVNNVLAQDWISENWYTDRDEYSHRRTVFPGTMFVRATLEMKF